MFLGVAVLIILLGIALRVVPSAGFGGIGFDESLYRSYVVALDEEGLASYPEITESFLRDQRNPESITKLPPTRFTYIYTAWIWKRIVFGNAAAANLRTPGAVLKDPALVSLHRVACLFSILTLVLAGVVAWRMFDQRIALGVLALLAFSPLQIHMSQHALIDGFFAFWAFLSLWLLWENLRAPNHAGWLTAYGVSLGIMVMTKENSFFVYCALLALLVANRWTRFGKVSPRLLLVSVLGPLVGLTLLIVLAGGTAAFVEVYTMLVSKAQNLQYAIKTGDGPWYRYLIDLLLISPVVLLLALGGAFRLLPVPVADAGNTLMQAPQSPGGYTPQCPSIKTGQSYLYLLLFVAATYLIMCNVKYGMNLRYATIWDFPLRVMAFGQLCLMTRSLGPRQPLVLVVAVAALCAYDLRQYLIFFADAKLYELASEGLLRAVKILK